MIKKTILAAAASVVFVLGASAAFADDAAPMADKTMADKSMGDKAPMKPKMMHRHHAMAHHKPMMHHHHKAMKPMMKDDKMKDDKMMAPDAPK